MPRVLRSLPAVLTLALVLGCEAEVGIRSHGAGPPRSRGEWIDAALAPLAIGDRVSVRSHPVASPSWPGAAPGDHGLPGLIQAVAQVVARPGDPAALEGLGRALLELSREEAAEAAFRTALDLAPDRPAALRGLAIAAGRLGRRHDAVLAWRAAIAAGDESAESRAALAAARYLDGDANGARMELDSARAGGAAVSSALEVLLAGAPSAAASGNDSFELGPEVRVDAGGATQAAEPTVAGGGGVLVAAWNDLREAAPAGEWRLGVAASTDAGESWTDRILRAPAPFPPFVHEGDPMAAFDGLTGNLWVGGQRFGSGSQVYVARRSAGGTGFDPPVAVAAGAFFDRPWMTAGRPPGATPGTRLYVTYSAGDFQGALHASTDLGASWSLATTMPAASSFLPRIGPGGALWIAYYDFIVSPTRYVVLRSSNGGASFDVQRTAAIRIDDWGFQDGTRFPGKFRVPPLHAFAVDPVAGDLYVAWFDTARIVSGQADVDVFVTRSTDAGITWSTPVVPHAITPTGDQFFPWLEISADGRLHLAYLDSRRTVQLDDDLDGRFDVYYATSVDHGATWTETPVTDTPFSSLDATWPGFDQFLGDHLGLAIDDDGAVLVYPSTRDGDLDILTRRVRADLLFASGFESGDLSEWSGGAP